MWQSKGMCGFWRHIGGPLLRLGAAALAAAVPDLASRAFDALDAIAKVEAMRPEGRPHSGHG